MREALYYHEKDNCIICDLCPHACRLEDNQTGLCRGRKAYAGKLYAINYGNSAGMAIDPIEKKPLYHFNPGTMILSLGPNSCNLSCSFCQNWQISQVQCVTYPITIEDLYSQIVQMDCQQVAFTYTEPMMWYEFIMDFANSYPDVQIVIITNGYLKEEPWKAMLNKVSAMNIDLKSIRNEFYKTVCKGDVATVKRNIELAYSTGIHLELTYLLIPESNATDKEIEELAKYVASIDPMIPLHISAYHPSYKDATRATSPNEVMHACDIAAKCLKHVYAGNVFIPKYSRR